MLVNIIQTFDVGSRRYIAGENVDVEPQIAQRWIADGWAAEDRDGRQDMPGIAATLAERLFARRDLCVPLTAAAANAPAITLSGAAVTIPSPQTIGKDDPCFVYLGPALQQWPNDSNFVYPAVGAAFMSVMFCTDSPLFEIRLSNFTSKVMIFVDDQPALTSSIATTAAGTYEYVKLDFAGVRKARTIRVEGNSMPFGGLKIGASDSVWSPSVLPPVACIMGDSYTQGTGANAPSFAWALTCARALGYWCAPEGIGGTGWNSASPNTPAERVAARGVNALVRRQGGVNVAVTPDVSLLALGYNDYAGSMATAAAAFDAYWAAATRKPDAIIGPWTPVGETAGLITVKTMLQAKAVAYGRPYIDIANWVNSVNKSALTGGDNVHPNQAGHDFLGFRIAQTLAGGGIA